MSKNAEGWIRHRGGKCPVDDGDLVRVRYRDGTEAAKDAADNWAWHHTKDDDDIMAYKLHKPAEQVEPESYFSKEEAMAYVDAHHSFDGELDGPLQWRDRIVEIDVEVQARTVERAELVQKLASEGVALIGRINELLADAAQKHEDMSDPKNWREGDILLQTAKNIHGAAEGELWTMAEDDGTTAKRYTRQNGDSWYVSDSHLCFHSRPSA